MTKQAGAQPDETRILFKRIDVVLPAGGRISGEFAKAAGVEIKALIALGGETILRRTIRAFRATGRVGQIVVVGPEAALTEAREAGAEGTVLEGATGPENIFRGMDWLRAQPNAADRYIISPTDMPFLTAESIVGFLEACPSDADVALPIFTKQEFESRFSGSHNIFVPLREGMYCNGGVFLVNPQAVYTNRAHLEGLFAARKSQWQMARLVGWQIALRLATKQLSIPALEKRCLEIAHCKGVAVRGCSPELGYDIDQPSELEYARAHYDRLAAATACDVESPANQKEMAR